MSLLCALGGHEADRSEVYNSGFYFSACRRCGQDMMRTGATWQMVPRGHRIVWKTGGRHRHSIEADYAVYAPVVHREANLPAVKPSYVSWNRQLVRSAGAGIGGGGAASRASVREEPEELAYPYMLALAAIVGAGLQLVLGFGSRSHGY
jgi:hypothetical protein